MLTGNTASTMPWIIMDLDDSACDFGPHVYREFARHHGATVRTFEELDDYHKMDVHLGCSLDQFFQRLDDLRIYETVPPFEHMLHALQCLSDRGYLVQWTTARGRSKNARAVTLNWLMEHRFPVDRLVVTQPGESKLQHVPINTQITVEDSFIHCQTYAAAVQGQHFLVNRPWNQRLVGGIPIVRGNSHQVADWLTTIAARTGD